MVELKRYREYWEQMVSDLVAWLKETPGSPFVNPPLAVSVDEDVAKKIRELPLGSVTLFWIPPTAESVGSTLDDLREKNNCVVFLMERFDTLRDKSYDVLERTQPLMEWIKENMLATERYGCARLGIEPKGVVTMPETKFFAGFAGWSLGFKIIAS